MDERLRAFAWILGSGCCGAALGTAFGGLAGTLYGHSGRASGTRLAYRLVEAFGRAVGSEVPRTFKNGLIGAVDGFLFLGALGTLMGAAAAYSGRIPFEMLRPALFLTLLLFGGAAFFGVLAYSMTRAGVRAAGMIAAAGVLGAALGSYWAGRAGLLFGSISGIVVGTAAGLLWPTRYEPEFAESHFPPESSEPRFPDDDGIQGPSGIER